MSAVWVSVLCVGVATIAIKAAGPVLAGDRELPLRTGRMVALVGPALLAALVATQAFSSEELVLDERGAGLLAAAVAIAMRAPLIAVVLTAALAAALLRLAT